MYYTNIYAGIDLPMREERKMGGGERRNSKDLITVRQLPNSI